MRATCLSILVLTLVPAVVHAQTASDQAVPPPPPGAQPAPQPDAQPVAPPPSTPALPPPPPGATPYPPPAYGAQPAYGTQPNYGPQPTYGAPYGQPMYGQPGYPPSYGYPPGYMPTPMLRHREMPYNGGPVPPGAVVETRRMMSLVIGGGVLFGVGYLVSVLDATGNGSITCATSSCGASWLYVPIVGPWVALGYSGHPTADDVFIVLDGVAQAVGVVGFVVGMLNSRQVLVFNDMARRDLRRPRWMLTPGAPGAPAGATFSLLQF